MEFSDAECERHNALIREAQRLIDGEIIIHGQPLQSRPGFFTRRRLKRAISLYEDALRINPEGWQSMWTIGKICQRLGHHDESLRWFVRAHELNPVQVDVAREAGIAALDCGAADVAVRICFAAVRLSPDDLGLQSNLSLAYLLAGDDRRADECSKVASERAPDDPISRAVRSFVVDVISGRRKRPKRLVDAFPVQ